MCVNSTCSAFCIIILGPSRPHPPTFRSMGLQDSALRFVPSAQYPKSIDEKNRHPLVTVLALKTHASHGRTPVIFKKKSKKRQLKAWEFDVSQKNGDLKLKTEKNQRFSTQSYPDTWCNHPISTSMAETADHQISPYLWIQRDRNTEFRSKICLTLQMSLPLITNNMYIHRISLYIYIHRYVP